MITFTDWYNEFWKGKDGCGLEYPAKAKIARDAYEGQYGKLDEGEDEDLARNAEYRQQAVQPMIDELKIISLKLDTVNTLLMTQNDLLAELIRRTR